MIKLCLVLLMNESDIQSRKYSLGNWNEHFQVVVCWVLWNLSHEQCLIDI